MSFLKGWLDYLKNHIYSIFRVHKLMYNCQITCDHNSRTFFVQALSANPIKANRNDHFPGLTKFHYLVNILKDSISLSFYKQLFLSLNLTYAPYAQKRSMN